MFGDEEQGLRMECHLGDNWLLVWRATAEEIVLVLTGTHDDLYG